MSRSYYDNDRRSGQYNDRDTEETRHHGRWTAASETRDLTGSGTNTSGSAFDKVRDAIRPGRSSSDRDYDRNDRRDYGRDRDYDRDDRRDYGRDRDYDRDDLFSRSRGMSGYNSGFESNYGSSSFPQHYGSSSFPQHYGSSSFPQHYGSSFGSSYPQHYGSYESSMSSFPSSFPHFGAMSGSGFGLSSHYGSSYPQHYGSSSMMPQHYGSMMPHHYGSSYGSMPQHYGSGFDNMGSRSRSLGQGSRSSTGRPEVDIYELGSDYVIEMDLPGHSRDHIETKLFGNDLVISSRPPKRDHQYHINERSLGRHEVSRRLVLPNNADSQKINAALTNGVLKITIPKTLSTGVTTGTALPATTTVIPQTSTATSGHHQPHLATVTTDTTTTTTETKRL